jgi:hypothetical protein
MRKLGAAALLACWLLASTAPPASPGQIYRITSKDGDRTVSYEVTFGGGLAFERYTAFDPHAKKFVYLDWKRGEPAPRPVGVIWDHRTGERLPLYKFPGAQVPLPVIPGVQAIKVCPLTGDRHFTVKSVGVHD